MRALYFSIKCLLVLSFLAHSYMLLTPAIDTFGFVGCFIYAMMMIISWALFIATKYIKEDENEMD